MSMTKDLIQSELHVGRIGELLAATIPLLEHNVVFAEQ